MPTPTAYDRVRDFLALNAIHGVWEGRFSEIAPIIGLHEVTVRSRVAQMVTNGHAEWIQRSDGSCASRVRVFSLRRIPPPPEPKTFEYTALPTRRPPDNPVRRVAPGTYPAERFSMLGGRIQ